MEVTQTHRHFALIKFEDSYGESCSLQKSSAAFEDKVWLGRDDPKPVVLHGDAKKLGVATDATCGWVPFPIPSEVMLSSRMHLTRAQVAGLLPYLQRFVETGELL